MKQKQLVIYGTWCALLWTGTIVLCILFPGHQNTHGAFYTRGNETTAIIRVVDMVAEGFDCREACSEDHPNRLRDEACYAEAENVVNSGIANTIELPAGICQF